VSADIFAGQPSDSDLLARIYDLEHDEVVEDHAFYRELARRHPRAVLDLGCGSGRLFRAFVDGGAQRVVGVESLVVLAGVLPHLDGPEEALALLGGVATLLDPRHGIAVLDDIGPGLLPARDLPLSLDWRRVVDGTEYVRRSQLIVREAPEGLRVAFSTLVDVGRPDGTIARLPASHRLWYPWSDVLATLVREAGLAEELAYGSHDLDPPADDSERRIQLVRRAAG
jgi:SAM-dependent methyltransferase